VNTFLASLNKVEQFALGLLLCDFNEHELAFAMNWNVPEAQSFRSRVKRALRRPD
jgi:hypothetical protein